MSPDFENQKIGQESPKTKIAPESPKTKRTREKILKEWEKQDFLITESALAEAIDKIYKWIAANAVNRVSLREKDINLFDQNKNAAALSQKVKVFAKRLYDSLSQSGANTPPIYTSRD